MLCAQLAAAWLLGDPVWLCVHKHCTEPCLLTSMIALDEVCASVVSLLDSYVPHGRELLLATAVVQCCYYCMSRSGYTFNCIAQPGKAGPYGWQQPNRVVRQTANPYGTNSNHVQRCFQLSSEQNWFKKCADYARRRCCASSVH